VRLTVPRPTGIKNVENKVHDSVASRQATALADLTPAEAGARLVLDWSQPLNHAAFYKAAYRPAVLRANLLTPTAAGASSRGGLRQFPTISAARLLTCLPTSPLQKF
jgi:hypothetical protein